MSQVYKNFTPEFYEVIYSAAPEDEGLRLDQFAQKFLASFSRERVKKKIARGDIKILDRIHPQKGSVRVHAYERIRICTFRENLEDEFWRGEKIEFESPVTIYEDEKIIVFNKPPFMAAHPTGRHLFFTATVYFENLLGHQVYSVHRLDRETSGCLILAKDVSIAAKLTHFFETGKIAKIYLFIAHKNKNTQQEFCAKERLGLANNFIPNLFTHAFDENSTEGKRALTFFKILASNDEYVVGLASPITGRQHQIRVHASHHGLPLVGDKLYNGDPSVFTRSKDMIPTEEDFNKMQIPRHALQAIALQFAYPQGEQKTFIAPISLDLKKLMHDLNFNTQEIESSLGKNIESALGTVQELKENYYNL